MFRQTVDYALRGAGGSVAPRNQEREARAARQRLRDYQARQQLHSSQVTRRKRDNIVAAIVVLLVVAAAVTVQLFYFNGGPGTPLASPSPSASDSAAPTPEASAPPLPDPSFAQNRQWTGDMTLNGVDLGIQLDGDLAPQAVSSFISLSQAGFYDGLSCHRLTTGQGFSVLQCGDPKGDGSGGPGYSYGPIENAPANNVYPAGTIAMARVGDDANSNGSQFFIVYGDTTIPSDSAGGYTVLGKVTSGLDQLKAQVTDAGTADGSSDGAPKVPVKIGNITVQ
jgi:peptidyl-prolyl cis-trans isomerase B (cyclophilin B)